MGARRIVSWTAAVIIFLGLAAWTGAADKGDAESGEEAAKAEPLVLRMYNIDDFMPVPDFPSKWRDAYAPMVWNSPLDPCGWEPFHDRPNESGRTYYGPEQVVDLIKRVFSGNWADEGGPATINVFGNHLVVMQTEANHKKIAELLALFRTARPAVQIEAKGILVDQDKVAKLVPDDLAKRTVPQEVTPAALKESGATVVYRGQTTCFDRQLVHLVSIRSDSVMTDVEPVVAEYAIGWRPTVVTLPVGAVLEVTPALSPDGKSVTLKVFSMITEDLKKTIKVVEGTTGGKAGGPEGVARIETELPSCFIHTLKTSVRAPLDRVFIVGGLTSPKAVDGKVLYLAVSVSASREAEATKK